MVKQFYGEVAHLPHITDHAIGTVMQQLSIHNEFDTIAALKELYIYVTKYRDQVYSKNSEKTHTQITRKININIIVLNISTAFTRTDTRCTEQRFELHKRSFGAEAGECRVYA